MQSDNRNISKDIIDLEIYKIFEQFKTEKNIRIVDFLKKLNISVFKEHDYRGIKFSYEALFKLILFQKLKGIMFHTRLTKYLRQHQKEGYALGFDTIPDRRIIGYFIHHILNNETKDLLEFIAQRIEDISEKFGILFDVKTLEPEPPQKDYEERNQRLLKNDKTKEICRLFKKRFAPFINLNLKNNTLYKKNQFIDLLIHMGMTRDFAENGSKTYKELRGQDNPDADTLLYHLKNYTNYRDLHRMFTTLFEIRPLAQ